ncbi:hypothetical protein J3E74DRAFT_431473 [Bipolaris maydis]|nr:hypothetical protein J3E74DRAFT_433960 [Bipolaris maydis]KAJ5056333.1 hypothetical protein J3E74DRAFT_431473 [Bipolaris maydis]
MATAIGPLVAAFIVQYSPGSWVDYVWVCAALAGANLVAIYLPCPESNFVRPGALSRSIQPDSHRGRDPEVEKETIFRTETTNRHYIDIVPKPWLSIWANIVTINHDTGFIAIFLRPLKMLLSPSVMFSIFVYGTSLAAQIILIFAFPSLLQSPPCLFSSIGVVSCFMGGYVADLITAAVIRRHDGAVYSEQRLISLISEGFVAPAGCIVVAFACSEKLHWVAIAFGFGMVSFGTVYAPNIVITYVAEGHQTFATESLVTINIFKILVAFLFLFTATDWIAAQGWVQVYMIMIMLVSTGTLLAIPVLFLWVKVEKRVQAP